ncbi:MAG: lysine biosynthesis protein LysW [Planctomycetota bacterium]
MAQCPICEAEVTLPKGTIQGELIGCPDCGSDLEVVKINPVVLQEAPQEEEDWGQ